MQSSVQFSQAATGLSAHLCSQREGSLGGTRMLVRPESRWKRGLETVFTSSVLSSSPQPQLWAEPVASFFKILVTAGAGFLRQA